MTEVRSMFGTIPSQIYPDYIENWPALAGCFNESDGNEPRQQLSTGNL